MAVVAVVIAGCSTGEASDRERLEDAVLALADAGAPRRVPSAAHVDTVVCEPLATPSYACTVRYGEGTDIAIFPFCAELRDGAVYMNSAREGCDASSRGSSYHRATSEDFG